MNGFATAAATVAVLFVLGFHSTLYLATALPCPTLGLHKNVYPLFVPHLTKHASWEA